MKKHWMIAIVAVSALLMTGCGTATQNASSTTPEQNFLSFVPQNEPGAPHDMQYIIENSAGDGGYYGTDIFPGTLTVATTTKGYAIVWKINGLNFRFTMSSNGNSIVPTNETAQLAIVDMQQGDISNLA